MCLMTPFNVTPQSHVEDRKSVGVTEDAETSIVCSCRQNPSSFMQTLEEAVDAPFRFSCCTRIAEWLDQWVKEVDRLFPDCPCAVLLVNPESLEFEPAIFSPVMSRGWLEKEINAQIDNGAFAKALRSRDSLLVGPVGSCSADSFVFQPLGTHDGTLGMSCVVLEQPLEDCRKYHLRLLSTIAHSGGLVLEKITRVRMAGSQTRLRASCGSRQTESPPDDDLERSLADLQLVNDELRAQDAMKTQFLSIISHEIRNSLGSMTISLDLIKNGLPSQVQQDLRSLVSVCRRNAKRLHRLVTDLLDLSRLELGKANMKMSEEDLVSIIESAVESYRPLAMSKGLSLHAQTPRSLLCRVDRDRITQVLHNLVENAINFTAKGRVVLRLDRVEDHGEITVSDTGEGIPSDELSSIFDMYKQGDRLVTRHGSGTGLGLTIAKAIVQEHGGRLWVESRVGKGSDFVVALPTVERGAR